MKCPMCVVTGQRSTFHGGNTGFSTAMAEEPDYYDEDGNLHRHRRNVFSTSWYCSNGHHFHRQQLPSCPTCSDYGRDDWEPYEPTIRGATVTNKGVSASNVFTIRGDDDGLSSIGATL